MTKRNLDSGELSRTLRALAKASRPDVEEGVACKGTILESRRFHVGNKAFLFLSDSLARMKLRASVSEASKLAKREPGRFGIGSGGWAVIRFGDVGPAPSRELLRRWVHESLEIVVGAGRAAKVSKGGATKPRKNP